MNLPFFIARRYLLRQKGAFSSFIIRLAIVATSLSVAVMLLAIAFISGFKYTIREKLFSFWGHVHIAPYNTNPSSLLSATPVQINNNLIQSVKSMKHVSQVLPYAVRPAIVRAHGQMDGIKLKGIPEGYRFSSTVDFKGSKIDYNDTAYAHQLILSQTVANRLELNPGDSALLYFLEPGATFPRIRKLQIAGIFHTGMDEIDQDFAICDLRLLQRINNWKPNEINGYQVDLDNEMLADSLAEDIRIRYVEPPLTTHSIREIFPNIFDWLSLQDVNAQIIILIMAIVAVINLAVALMILIVEHTRMVGLLKALGMTQGMTQKIFLYHASVIAFAGIMAGNIIGLGFCWAQQRYGFLKLSEATYYMSQVPIRIHWWQVLLIDGATLVLCILCMWLPTLYIRRIQPAKVLEFK